MLTQPTGRGPLAIRHLSVHLTSRSPPRSNRHLTTSHLSHYQSTIPTVFFIPIDPTLSFTSSQLHHLYHDQSNPCLHHSLTPSPFPFTSRYLIHFLFIYQHHQSHHYSSSNVIIYPLSSCISSFRSFITIDTRFCAGKIQV